MNIAEFGWRPCGNSTRPGRRYCSHGFSLLELLLVLIVGMSLAAMAVPMYHSAMTNAQLNSMVNGITGAIGNTRYRAIMKSQQCTLTLTAPANTYLVTPQPACSVDPVVPLPGGVAINGGANATYTFTFCPNGTVWGGGACPLGNGVPPALTATSQGRQINLSISSVGNVTTQTIH